MRRLLMIVALLVATVSVTMDAEQLWWWQRKRVNTATGGGTPPVDPPAAGLVDITPGTGDLEYLGLFRIPQSYDNGDPLCGSAWADGNSGRALEYNEANDSLLVTTNNDCVGEITIPSSFRIVSNLADVVNAPAALNIKHPRDITGGLAGLYRSGTAPTTTFNCFTARLGGVLLYESRLLFSITSTYGCGQLPDDQVHMDFTHWAHSTNIYTPGISSGSYVKWPAANNNYSRWVNEYMGHIPTEFQSALGGDMFSGKAGSSDSVVAEQSDGPSFVVWDGTNVGVDPTIDDGVLLMGFRTLYNGAWGYYHDANGIWSSQGEIRGMVFIPGSYTILMVGRNGLATPGFTNGVYGGPLYPGGYCYGIPQSTDPANHNVTTGPTYCYNPQAPTVAPSQHAWPIRSQMWAVDVRDLIHVKNGDINPATGLTWNPGDITPYQYPAITVPNFSDSVEGLNGSPGWGGITIRRSDKTIFVAQKSVDSFAWANAPVIHVWRSHY